MTINAILTDNKLPDFVSVKDKQFYYEANRPVGVKNITANTMDELLDVIKEKKTYPPYKIFLVVDDGLGEFSIEIGFNGPEGNFIYSPRTWSYDLHVLSVLRGVIMPKNGDNIESKRFEDWYVKTKLKEMLYG